MTTPLRFEILPLKEQVKAAIYSESYMKIWTASTAGGLPPKTKYESAIAELARMMNATKLL